MLWRGNPASHQRNTQSCMFSSPNYGAASQHIAALMKEREDYEEAIRTQALRIQTLEAELAASREQIEVTALIG